MPDPGTFGNFCQRCFPLNETPDLLKLSISGVEKSPNFPLITESPTNGYADLTQSAPVCEWTGSGLTIWRASINWRVDSSQLLVEARRDLFTFTQNVEDICERYFVNAFQDPLTFAYNFGYAYLSTPAEMQAMIELALPITGPDPRMELFPKSDRQVVVRYASTLNGTNLKLCIDIDDL